MPEDPPIDMPRDPPIHEPQDSLVRDGVGLRSHAAAAAQ
jgi:hypothetical protein